MTGGSLESATSDDCTSAPLWFAGTCTFSGTAPSGAGGGQIYVKGSARYLRGTCRLQNPATGAFLLFDPMR